MAEFVNEITLRLWFRGQRRKPCAAMLPNQGLWVQGFLNIIIRSKRRGHVTDATSRSCKLKVRQTILTSTLIPWFPSEMFLRHRHIFPVEIGEMGREGRQGWAYKRVPIGSAARFNEEGGSIWVFIRQAAGEDGACEATSCDSVVVLGWNWRWHCATESRSVESCAVFGLCKRPTSLVLHLEYSEGW
jgi:hypothetical protein